MALTGELTDLSLAELIEFFCNQRKTGRLKVVYPTGPGYFYLQSGSVVHARVGDLRGIDAVYFALTQRNASFTFSPAFEAPEHSIHQPWTSVVLEGLRRMDEGIHPPNPFSEESASSVEEIEPFPIEEIKTQPVEAKSKVVEPVAAHVEKPAEVPQPRLEKPPQVSKPPAQAVPFQSHLEQSSRFATKPWKLGLVFAAILLIVGVVAVPWGWYSRSKAARSANEPKPVVTEQAASNSEVTQSESPVAQPETEAVTPAANSEAADLARRQHEARLREEARARDKAAEATALPGQQTSPAAATQSAPKPQMSPLAGAKKVTVQVTYDENGRVTQASGGDATALRIARQKRFPAGKAGSATITIPIN